MHAVCATDGYTPAEQQRRKRLRLEATGRVRGRAYRHDTDQITNSWASRVTMAAVLYLRLRSDPEPVKLEDPGDGESEVRLYAVDVAEARAKEPIRKRIS